MSDVQGDDRCAEVLRALADPVRLRIVKCLQVGELSVSDVADILEVDLANASHHLRVLKTAGLAFARREGKYAYYSLNPAVHSLRKATGESDFDLGCCRFMLPRDESASSGE